MIMTKVKRLLQSVEEASIHQIAAELGVDQQIVAATVEHFQSMGRVVCTHVSSGSLDNCATAATSATAATESGQTPMHCAGCPMVRVCDPKNMPSATAPEHEVVYSWVSN